ncbi:N-acetylmuramoyl-L-alanine amidase [Roseomonas sp. BU-1]|uniref:N-acetylmuramoyl-L-alanine amidase n=1 Tax=Falsiroseomonas selenitidurans TaxID=2716335 RepID=A0ABX1EB87_9PROT|nr:N-acetylmuramoyl-L-alanine amidase [Falsiroseomonas selenitidurans]OYW09835.1 MAG: N-acetylmuramoyl-L-alanine amidase [Rhodospirillales bacterium 12-71-4]
MPSPNQDDRPLPVDMLVLHYTGMRSGAEAIARLRDPAARVSSHYVVEEDGAVFRLVPEDRRAWHAGLSHWRGHELLNGRSVGIEIVNPGHEFGYRPFPALQMAAVCELCLGIIARHGIAPRDVVAHSDVAPDRKQDPGELFDWEGLAANGVGLWPAGTPVPAPDQAGAPALLARIGYRTDLPLPVLLRAFQLHWWPRRIDGVADAATLARLAEVAAACG